MRFGEKVWKFGDIFILFFAFSEEISEWRKLANVSVKMCRIRDKNVEIFLNFLCFPTFSLLKIFQSVRIL